MIQWINSMPPARARIRFALGAGVGLVVVSGLMIFRTIAWAAPVNDLPTVKVLPLSVAQVAAKATMDNCMGRGFPVSVTIVDRDSVPILITRADGATGVTIEVSREKAYAAPGFQSSTGALQEQARTNPGFIAIPSFSVLPGGTPIKSGDTTVAGIGVSGAPTGEIDADCAQAGLDAIAASL